MSLSSKPQRPRLAVVLQPKDRLDARGVPQSSVAIVALALARCLASDFEVAIVAPAAQPLPSVGPNGIRFLPVAVPDARKEDWQQLLDILRPRQLPSFARADFYRRYWQRVATVLADYAPDLVHVHAFAQGLCVLREKLRAARLLLHLHDPHPALLPPACLGPALALADRILTVSDFVRNQLRLAFPELATRICTVPNGVEVSRFAHIYEPAAKNAWVILQVGRISPEKGHHVLVRAFARIFHRLPHAKLLIVGRAGFFPWGYARLLAHDPVMRDALTFWGEGLWDRLWRQLLRPKQAYLHDLYRLLPRAAQLRVEIRPPLPHDQLATLYEQADVVAVPSVIEEPFGLPAIEAMAAGRAVVASRRGGIPECVEDRISGLLVPAGDDQQLKDALLELAFNVELRLTLGRNGRNRAALFDWSRAGLRLQQIVLDVLAESPSTSARTGQETPHDCAARARS